MPRWLYLASAALGVALTACLPTDTRTAPGSFYATASSSDATLGGFTTADGWNIAFDRVLVGIGRVNIGGRGDSGGSCNRYSNRGYMRLLDMRVSGAQKLAIGYALGQCSVSFRLSYPGNEAALGTHVTPDNLTFMNIGKPDGYEDPTRAGIAVYVKGTAARAGTIKRFEWAFRRSVSFTSCGDDATDAGARGVALHSNDAFTSDIAVHAEALFQDSRDPAAASLRFQPYADADSVSGDNDGEVTLAELGKVPIESAGIRDLPVDADGGVDAAVEASAPDAGAAGDASGADTWTTLEDYVYLGLVPVIARYKDIAGSCTVDEASAPDAGP